MDTKKCTKCKNTKHLSEFRLATGTKRRRSHCAQCENETNKEHYRKNKEKHPERYLKNKKILLERVKKYQATDAAKSKARARRKKYSKKALMCHRVIRKAIATGKIISPTVCESCGKGNRIHAHHDDYNYPLSVRWLCIVCHREWHRINGKGKNI